MHNTQDTVRVTGRIFQSLILTGENPVTLLEQAIETAARHLCQASASPCRVCSVCRKVFSHQHADLTILDNGPDEIIKVEQVRAIRKDAFVRPFDSDGKVYIVRYADNLNIASQNALLTLLEEPPAYALFILLCHNADGMLPTVRSRCVTKRLPPGDALHQDQVHIKRAQDYVAALPSPWERMAVAYSLEKLSRDEFSAFLSSLLAELQKQLHRAGHESRLFYLDKMDQTYACIQAVTQNASVGTLCGILAL